MTNHWNGKLWYAYGTSMTAQCSTEPDRGNYVETVVELSGLRLVNKGIGGACLTPDGWGKGNNKPVVMNTEDGKCDADLITLEILPNEGKVLGDIFDTDDNSICGCLNQAIRYLQENTRAQIVLIIMIRSNTQPADKLVAEGYDHSNFELVQKVELVAKYNGIPYINAFFESGFGYHRVKNRDYQLDQIHFNKTGGKIMGNFIWSKLKDIPLWMPED